MQRGSDRPPCLFSKAEKGAIAQRGGAAPTTSHSQGMQPMATRVGQAPGGRVCPVPGPSTARGQSSPPEAGSSGFPPPLGVSPGPPRELRFSPTRGTDRHNAESSNTARQRPPSPPRPRPLREQAHQPSEEKGVLQSDVEVPGPAGDDRLLPGLSFPPAMGKVRPNTLRT